MQSYSVIKLRATGKFVVDGDIEMNSVLVNIPDSDKKKKQYISIYVCIVDLRNALDTISFIHPGNHYMINRGLFIAGLAEMCKCFGSSNKYNSLSSNALRKFDRIAYKEFCRYKDIRNKHYIHHENEMTEASAFLPIKKRIRDVVFTGPPSVVIDIEDVDFLKEQSCLMWTIRRMIQFAEREFDKMADSIMKDYGNLSRNDLLSYGKARIKKAKCK